MGSGEMDIRVAAMMWRMRERRAAADNVRGGQSWLL